MADRELGRGYSVLDQRTALREGGWSCHAERFEKTLDGNIARVGTRSKLESSNYQGARDSEVSSENARVSRETTPRKCLGFVCLS